MKLLTKELEKELKKYPFGSQEGKGVDARVIVHFFNPLGAGDWFITEGEKLEDGDYDLFGFCHLGDDDMAEFGCVRLSTLENLKLPYQMKIERELHYPKDVTLKEELNYRNIKIPSWLEKDEEMEM